MLVEDERGGGREERPDEGGRKGRTRGGRRPEEGGRGEKGRTKGGGRPDEGGETGQGKAINFVQLPEVL